MTGYCALPAECMQTLLLFDDDRCLHIFWWEPLVAAYFVLAPAAVAWSIIGLTWAAKSADARHSGVSHECVSL